MVNELKAFLLRGNVVELAVAVVIGAAFKTVVDAFIEFLLNPVIGALFGRPDFSAIAITLRDLPGEEMDAVLQVGAFLSAVVNFLLVGSALFVVVRFFNALEARRRRGEEPAAEVPAAEPEDVVLLREIRDLLQTAQPQA